MSFVPAYTTLGFLRLQLIGLLQHMTTDTTSAVAFKYPEC